MRKFKTVLHILADALLLILLIGVPVLSNFDLFGSDKEADAVSSASIELPDQPSGDYMVLINRSLHEDSIEEWKEFFGDGEMVVIFDDVKCLVATADAGGAQLADRFRLELPENQMEVNSINPVLLASKAEEGYIDIAVFSKEMAESLSLDPESCPDIEVIEIKGDA